MKKKLLLLLLFALGMGIIKSFTQNYGWAKYIGKSGYTEEGRSIAFDKSGNVYITGGFISGTDFDPGPGTAILTAIGDTDVFFAKFDKDGKFLWAKSIGSAGHDKGFGINIDKSGNICLTGTFSAVADFDPSASAVNLTPAAANTIFFAKYDSNGNYIWAKTIAVTSFSWTQNNMAIDTSSNLYLTGNFSGIVDFDPGAGTANLNAANGYNMFFAKYDSSGNYIWAKNIGGTGGGNSNCIAVDASQNVYIGGAFFKTCDFDPSSFTVNLTTISNPDADAFFAKYDSSGSYVWARSIRGQLNEAVDIIQVDSAGNVYTAGNFDWANTDFDPTSGTAYLSPAGGSNTFFAKYNPNGLYIWANAINTLTSGMNNPSGMALDNAANIYLTGIFYDADFDPGAGSANLTSVAKFDVFIAKYNSNGNYIWAKNIGSISDDYGYDIKADNSGTVYIAGTMAGSADCDPSACSVVLNQIGIHDIFFAKYTGTSLQPVSICISTVDSTSTKNIIVWDKSSLTNIDSFRIYRENSTVYFPIATVPFDSLSMYVDTALNANPNIASYRYKISAIDSFGVESELSNHHETIFLQVTNTAWHQFTLTWNDYCGFPVSMYYIMRDSNSTGSWKTIDSVSFGTNTYIDSLPPADTVSYRIEVLLPTPCVVSQKNPTVFATTVKGSKSNSDNKVLPPASVAEISSGDWMKVYPNPSNGKFTVQSLQFPIREIEVYNLFGEKIYQTISNRKQETIGLDKVTGIYFLKVCTEKGIAVKKIVVE